MYSEIAPDLERFGDRTANEIQNLSVECERNPPTLQHYDGWGQRIDKIITCPAWNRMKSISAEEGLIAIAYEGKYGPHR